jgi:hypothetical protein
MVKQINFEDNILVLSMRIRMIQDMFLLDADPDFFLEKTMDDVDFIDRTLAIVLGDLLENKWLIERDEQLYNLSRTEYHFGELLSVLDSGSGSISGVKFPVIHEKIGILKKQSLVRQKTIDESMPGSGDPPPENRVVGSDELIELLKDFK